MSLGKKVLSKFGAIGKALVWLLYFICADGAVYYSFAFFGIDRNIYKGIFTLLSSITISRQKTLQSVSLNPKA